METLATHEWKPPEPDAAARVAMLVHGVNGWHLTWWRIGSALEVRGWRAMAVAQRGHGRSRRIHGAATIDASPFDEYLDAVLGWASER